MSVVRIPPTLREDTGGEREVIAQGETVSDLLDDLRTRFPTLDGKLEYANVYVGGEDIRTRDGFETRVSATDTVILLPAMAGGSRGGTSRFPRTPSPGPLRGQAASPPAGGR